MGEGQGEGEDQAICPPPLPPLPPGEGRFSFLRNRQSSSCELKVILKPHINKVSEALPRTPETIYPHIVLL